MPTVCYVPFCKSGRKKNPIKMKMFSAPKDEKLRKTWEKMIPRKDVLKVTHKVCEVHFEESDIIKGKIFIVNGKEDFFPTKWKLKEGALPRIFPGDFLDSIFNLAFLFNLVLLSKRLPWLFE